MLLCYKLPYLATLIPHQKVVPAQLGFGQPGGVYGETCLDHITFGREHAMKILRLKYINLQGPRPQVVGKFHPFDRHIQTLNPPS